MEAARIDFQQLRIKHLLYKSKVRSVLYGGVFDATFFSPSGPVGTWFESVGKVRYAQAPEMAELKRVHQDLTAFTLALYKLYSNGQIEQAHDGFKDVEKKSDQFLETLSRLEKRMELI